MSNPSIDLEELLAHSRRFAAALSSLFVHTASLVIPIAEQTDDPGWRAVAADLDLLVARLRRMAEVGAEADDASGEAGHGESQARWRLLWRARLRRIPQA